METQGFIIARFFYHPNNKLQEVFYSVESERGALKAAFSDSNVFGVETKNVSHIDTEGRISPSPENPTYHLFGYLYTSDELSEMKGELRKGIDSVLNDKHLTETQIDYKIRQLAFSHHLEKDDLGFVLTFDDSKSIAAIHTRTGSWGLISRGENVKIYDPVDCTLIHDFSVGTAPSCFGCCRKPDLH